MKLDLHIHSGYSRDASATAAEIVRRCKSVGLGGLAITDHNEIKGSLEAYAIAKAEGIIVVRGIEVSADEGHILALGVREPIPRNLPLQETVDRIRAAGGLAVAAHPGRFPSGIGMKRAMAMDFDAIEVLNGGSSKRSNSRAMAVAMSRRLPATGGSDAHEVGQAGKAWTVVEGASSEDDVIDAISKGKCTVGGRSRTAGEGARYSLETFAEWLRGDLRRL
jgi:predicted metal-dependent phosphoesterase TrpH